jgi:hypothetical protein
MRLKGNTAISYRPAHLDVGWGAFSFAFRYAGGENGLCRRESCPAGVCSGPTVAHNPPALFSSLPRKIIAPFAPGLAISHALDPRAKRKRPDRRDVSPALPGPQRHSVRYACMVLREPSVVLDQPPGAFSSATRWSGQRVALPPWAKWHKLRTTSRR